MKNKRTWLASVLVLGLVGMTYAFHGASPADDGLAMELRADKTSYLPGELVSLRFIITNKSKTPVPIPRESTVWDGNLKVFIAYENGPFREYFGPSWGTRDRTAARPVTLDPEQSFETEATLLWNQTVETAHLTKSHANQAANGRLKSPYALMDAGKYSIKAVLNNARAGSPVESEPVTITVEEPENDDREVWNRIKEDANYGLFIQTGGLAEHPKSPKTSKVASDLEQLLSLHPNNRYAGSIRSGLMKRHTAIERLDKDEQLQN